MIYRLNSDTFFITHAQNLNGSSTGSEHQYFVNIEFVGLLVLDIHAKNSKQLLFLRIHDQTLTEFGRTY